MSDKAMSETSKVDIEADAEDETQIRKRFEKYGLGKLFDVGGIVFFFFFLFFF